jgi:hypothetical protein
VLILRDVLAWHADEEHRNLLARYVDAFQRFDVAALTEPLCEDATMSMPPFGWWPRGDRRGARVLRWHPPPRTAGADLACRRSASTGRCRAATSRSRYGLPESLPPDR